MKKFVLFLMAVMLVSLPGVVKAESPTPEATADQGEVVEVFVPDVESRWFGVRWAFEKVSHSIQVVLARTDDKKDELEMEFAEKEELLIEKIAELSETNPELADKLSGRLDKLSERYDKRVEKLEGKMNKLEDREQEMESKMNQWMEKREEKKQELEQKKIEIRERINNPERGVQEGVENEVEEDEGQMMEGKGVKIQNAKPGVVRIR